MAEIQEANVGTSQEDMVNFMPMMFKDIHQCLVKQNTMLDDMINDMKERNGEWKETERN